MFAKLLIANRGEIACRVIRTAKRLGVVTVAVYSDADRDALHVRLADEAQRIGPPPAAQSYLNIEAILAAARACGAEAIHPGYGFLAENAAFASACQAAGIVFVGPSPEAIAAMGDKSAAKALMEKAGVPLVPGYHGENQDPGFLLKQAERIGFPVLIKPCAGGGGKGMHAVFKKNAFESELQTAKREAKSAFADDRVLLERYLERPRHIEVQVFGDARGGLVHLFERDCSVQRRHQKVLEEAPAPGMTDSRRREMGAAAIAAARAVRYQGAGTVEFIAEPGGRFYFMEMNTRLQVEHPVTEMITGLDLVEWQLRIAAGEPLPLQQSQIHMSGHAIEARLYAEDPENDFLPSTGKILHLSFPERVRADTGVETGSDITPWYDPMIAKLVVHGENRAAALERLRQALAETEVAGLTTNAGFLKSVLHCKDFADGHVDTGLIERSRDELFPPAAPLPQEARAAAALAELFAHEDAARERAKNSADPHSPWNAADGWRLGARHDSLPAGERLPDDRLRVRHAGRDFVARAVPAAREWWVFMEGRLHRVPRQDDSHEHAEDEASDAIVAPIPGKVIAMHAAPGAAVKKGAPLLVLEAMKMEHTILAPRDATVKAVFFRAGDQVLEGAELLRLEEA